MWREICLAFVVAVIGGTMLSIIVVDAQSTVDDTDSASCESSTFDEAVNLIKQGMNNVGLIREDLEVVNRIEEDLKDVKNVLGSDQQQNNGSSSIKEAVSLIREDLKDVKNILGSYQPQHNASSISKRDLEDLKAACASNQQQYPQTELSKQALVSSLIREYRTIVKFDCYCKQA